MFQKQKNEQKSKHLIFQVQNRCDIGSKLYISGTSTHEQNIQKHGKNQELKHQQSCPCPHLANEVGISSDNAKPF